MSAGAAQQQPFPPTAIWFGRVLAAFVRRELALVARYRFYLITRVLAFGSVVLALYFLSRFVGAGANPHLTRYGGDYLAFTVVGLLVTELQQVGVAALASRVRTAQLMGYLEAELASPAPPWMVLASAPVYEFVGATLRSTAYLLGAWWLLDVNLARANWTSVALAVPVVVLAFAGVGLLAAATTMLTRRANPVALVLGAASMFLSGVLYPVSVLPAWLQAVGQFLPLTHALEALRLALLLGAPPSALAASLRSLALFALLLAPAGLALFVFALRRARIDGSLSHY